MTQELLKLKEYLKNNNLKHSKPREKILAAFLDSEHHISAEDLYTRIHQKYPGIGQATVFRNLTLFCNAGLAQEVHLGDNTRRFEHKYNHTHHDHLICRECGSIEEVYDKNIEKTQDRLCKNHGFLAEYHQLEIYGLCHKCQ